MRKGRPQRGPVGKHTPISNTYIYKKNGLYYRPKEEHGVKTFYMGNDIYYVEENGSITLLLKTSVDIL